MNQQVSEQQRSLQIVQAFSEVDVPDSLYKESNVARLVKNVKAMQEDVKSSNDKLGDLRTEKEKQAWYEGWSLLGDSTEDKIQDEHLNLNRRMATLAQHSSELLVVNTALSKVLCDQQRLLLDQQGTLARQAEDIEEQNGRIQEGQEQLAEFQALQLASNDALGMRLLGVTERLEQLAQRAVTFEQAVASAHDRALEVMDDRLAEQREGAQRDYEVAWTAIDELRTSRQRDLATLTDRLAALMSEQLAAQTRLAALDARLDAYRRVLPLVVAGAAAATGIATWLATWL